MVIAKVEFLPTFLHCLRPPNLKKFPSPEKANSVNFLVQRIKTNSYSPVLDSYLDGYSQQQLFPTKDRDGISGGRLIQLKF